MSFSTFTSIGSLFIAPSAVTTILLDELETIEVIDHLPGLSTIDTFTAPNLLMRRLMCNYQVGSPVSFFPLYLRRLCGDLDVAVIFSLNVTCQQRLLTSFPRGNSIDCRHITITRKKTSPLITHSLLSHHNRLPQSAPKARDSGVPFG